MTTAPVNVKSICFDKNIMDHTSVFELYISTEYFESSLYLSSSSPKKAYNEPSNTTTPTLNFF